MGGTLRGQELHGDLMLMTFVQYQAGPFLLAPGNELSQDISTYRERIVLVDRVTLRIFYSYLYVFAFK